MPSPRSPSSLAEASFKSYIFPLHVGAFFLGCIQDLGPVRHRDLVCETSFILGQTRGPRWPMTA